MLAQNIKADYNPMFATLIGQYDITENIFTHGERNQ